MNDLIKQIKEDLKPDFDNVAINRIILQKDNKDDSPDHIVNEDFDATFEAPLMVRIIETTRHR